jgi:hypothetical protein
MTIKVSADIQLAPTRYKKNKQKENSVAFNLQAKYTD